MIEPETMVFAPTMVDTSPPNKATAPTGTAASSVPIELGIGGAVVCVQRAAETRTLTAVIGAMKRSR